jgi:16S rRNA (guanine1207-N2)-methyltransferase
VTAAQAVYGRPPRELAEPAGGAVQLSPLIPGSQAIEDVEAGSLESLVILAPPGSIERRYVLAQGLRAIRPDGSLTVLAPKDKGGSRLAKELTALGATFEETARRHHRICVAGRAAELALDEALQAGAPRFSEALGLWTQPGVFSWDRLDPGTGLLLAHLPPLAGRGADLGAGLGVLSRAVLAKGAVTRLTLVETDRRALDCARRNIDDARADFLWADVRHADFAAGELDFVVMNPPFHDGGAEDRALGQAFIATAAGLLKPAGRLLMVANRHLPYEAVLKRSFSAFHLLAEAQGFKVFEARA